MSFLIKNILVTLVLLFIIEVTAYSLLNNDRYNEIYSVLRADSRLMWRVASNYSDNFFDADLETDDHGFRINKHGKNCKERIAIFGASPSFGWGITGKDTYTSLLNQKYENQGKCFFNFSAIGYSSSQGLELMNRVLEKSHFDAVIATYLVNDVDFNRFYFPSHQTDREVIKELSVLSLSYWGQRLRDTYLFKLMRQWLLDDSSQEGRRSSILASISNQRVLLAEYLDNIESMIKLTKQKKTKFYYLEMPVGIHTMAQYLQGKCKIASVTEDITLSEKAIEGCDLKSYSNLFTKNRSLPIDQVRSIIAMNRFKKYRNEVRSILEQRKVYVIKTKVLDISQIEDHFLSKNNDYVHPSPLGHRVIAENIIKALD